jgi:spore maturation protein CgeB
MTKPLDIVFIGLSLSSAWGNGHATTFRALLRGLSARGCSLTFLEQDVPWYASHRDLPEPDFCDLILYPDVESMIRMYGARIARADAVVIGSYVRDGVSVIDAVSALSPRRLCFYDIDTPVTLAKLDRGDEEYLSRRQMSLFDIYFSFSGGEVLGTLERDYGVRRAAALYCAVDRARYSGTGEPIRWDLGYLGTYSPDRQPGLERLLIEPARQLPQMRFVVAGPQFPADIDWPSNVERIDHVSPEEHASFYSRQRFTLNITRADMVAAGWSPSVRLFEAAACGVPIISDYWRGLPELLPDGILIARGTQDVVHALAELPEQRRGDIAARARATVLHKHTGEARADEMIAALSGVPAAPRAPIIRPIERQETLDAQTNA